MLHFLDGIMFGMGFALVNIPIEILVSRFKKRRASKARKVANLRLIKNSRN